jgi:hypothetical protein
MARFKNTVADVEAKLITKKNTVLIMQEDVQVVLSKSGVAEQERNFSTFIILLFHFLFQTSVEMNPADGKLSRPTSLSLHDDHDDEDHAEEEHDGFTFKVLMLILCLFATNMNYCRT